jgi:molecular chaperone DnaK (HSP70)
VNTSAGGLHAIEARTAQSIGIEVYAGREQLGGVPPKAASGAGRAVVLIAAGARLPAARAMTFTTVADRQRAIEVRVVRCTADARPSGVVGRFLLPGLPDGLRGEARIDIGLSLDREGVLRAWASERSCGARQEASFAGLWALEPDKKPDAIAALARRVDAGIERLGGAKQGSLRSDRDEAARWGREGEPIVVHGGAAIMADTMPQSRQKREGVADKMPQSRQQREGVADRMPQSRQQREGVADRMPPGVADDYATALATLAGEIDTRAARWPGRALRAVE